MKINYVYTYKIIPPFETTSFYRCYFNYLAERKWEIWNGSEWVNHDDTSKRLTEDIGTVISEDEFIVWCID